MKKLLNSLQAIRRRIQLRTHDQHVAYLKQLLDDLYLDAQEIDADIEIATDQLLQAQVKRDAAALRYEQVDTRSALVDRRSLNPISRSY